MSPSSDVPTLERPFRPGSLLWWRLAKQWLIVGNEIYDGARVEIFGCLEGKTSYDNTQLKYLVREGRFDVYCF